MKKKTITFFEIIFTLISIYCCFASETINGYDRLFYIPLIYFICLIFIKINDENYFNNISYISLDVLTFIKYSLMPFLIVIMGDFYGGNLTSMQIPGATYIYEAIFLTIIECLSIFLVIFMYQFFSKKSCFKKFEPVSREISFGPIMCFFIIISLLFVLKHFDSFIPKQLFIIDSDYENVTINSSIDGLINIIFFCFKTFCMLFITQFFVNKFKKKEKFIYVIGIFLSLIFYLGINTSSSRWNLIMPILAYMYIIKDIWFKNRINRTAIIAIICVFLVSFVSISLYKFSWLFKDQEKVSLREVSTVLAAQVQEYFSGPRAIAQGIQTYEIYGNMMTFETCLNDFIGSVPYFSKFVDQNNRSNIYFNYLLKGHYTKATQIMPMISIGYSYFTIGFCYLFTIICVFLSLKCGEVVSSAKDIFRKYIYCIMSIWLALCIGFNTQIIFGWFISSFLPFVLIIIFNDNFKIKRG